MCCRRAAAVGRTRSGFDRPTPLRFSGTEVSVFNNTEFSWQLFSVHRSQSVPFGIIPTAVALSAHVMVAMELRPAPRLSGLLCGVLYLNTGVLLQLQIRHQNVGLPSNQCWCSSWSGSETRSGQVDGPLLANRN